MTCVAKPREAGILPAGFAALVLASIALLAWPDPARPAGGTAPPLVRGFVSGALLESWCTRSDPRDVEACFSYLRGVFDVLNGLEAGADAPPASAIVHCIPDRVSVTELRAVFVRYAAGHPAVRDLQGSIALREALDDNYDCP